MDSNLYFVVGTFTAKIFRVAVPADPRVPAVPTHLSQENDCVSPKDEYAERIRD